MSGSARMEWANGEVWLSDAHSYHLAMEIPIAHSSLLQQITYAQKRSQPFRERQIKLWIRQIAHGLTKMHAHRVVHRDIKPENILIRTKTSAPGIGLGYATLGDLGSAKYLPVEPLPSPKTSPRTGRSSQLMPAGSTEYVGTRWYRAPEQLLTQGGYGLEIDLWALGCVLFEALTLAPLFPGRDNSHQVTLIMALLGSPKPELVSREGWDLPQTSPFLPPGTHNTPQTIVLDQKAALRRLLDRKTRSAHFRVGDDALDLLARLLTLDPKQRYAFLLPRSLPPTYATDRPSETRPHATKDL